MAGAEARLAALQDALAKLTAGDAEQVVAEARAEARARVRAVLADALADSLTEAVERRLAPGPHRSPDTTASAPREHPQPAPAPAREAAEASVPRGTYVYGVVWANDAPFIEELSGLDADGPVSTVIEGPLAAVVSHVPLAEFEEEELRTHLSDIEWVERVARAHEAVLDDLCARTVVVPMRMCTVYRSDENLRSMLQREETGLRAALEFLDGKLEWGVKVVAREASEAGPAPDGGAAADDARAASSGADYLARRRARRDEQVELESRHADAAAEIHDALVGLAHDGQLNALQNGELPGHQGRLVMNGVYLVERESIDSFHQEVEELERRFAPLGLELVRTGPWPPYNFVPGDVGAAW